MFDISRVYSTFGNKGKSVDIYGIKKITDHTGKTIYEKQNHNIKNIITHKNSFLITKGLQSVLQYGTGIKAKHLSNIAAGKTGTTNKSRDNWFCGYTSNILINVWAGSDSFQGFPSSFQGSSLPLDIWIDIIEQYRDNNTYSSFIPPKKIIRKHINPLYGNFSPSGIEMWFSEDNPPSNHNTVLEVISREKSHRLPFK